LSRAAPHPYYLAHTIGLSAENELFHWPTNLASTVQGIITAAINSFYRESPGGAHYQNIVGPYTQIRCGIYVDANGISIVEEFR